MTISFLMPDAVSDKPVGGYKVIFEYANRLVRDGYQVNIIYPRFMSPEGSGLKLVLKRLYVSLLVVRHKSNILKNYTNSWFALDKRVNEVSVKNLKEKNVPKSDVYIATYYSTADYLQQYNQSKGKKFYFIQGFENFHVGDARVLNTYKYKLRKIVIAEWLKQKCTEVGESATVVHNGFDFDYFKMDRDIITRDPYTVSLLYNPTPWKGFAEALEALKLVKQKCPQLKALLFGVYDKPAGLPDWVTYYQKPDKATHNLIYNSSSVFIAASKSEGWGLPVGEAMICGAAVACTRIGGFSTMATHYKTALLSDVGDIAGMAANIISLIEQDDLRHRIARSGHEHIQQFSWDTSYTKLKDILTH